MMLEMCFRKVGQERMESVQEPPPGWGRPGWSRTVSNRLGGGLVRGGDHREGARLSVSPSAAQGLRRSCSPHGRKGWAQEHGVASEHPATC